MACWPRLAREQAHGHGAEQQQLGAVGEGFVQHFGERKARPSLTTAQRQGAATTDLHGNGRGGLAAAQGIGHEHGQDDGGRLHQGHGSGHVAAVGDALGVEVGRGRDEGDSADRTVGGSHGRGIKARNETAQQQVAGHRHDHGQRHRQPQARGHLRREARLRQREAALEPQRHQQVQRQEARDGRGNFEVGLDESGKDAEDEEQDGGVDQGVHGRAFTGWTRL
jgi:hypothetical protein